MNFQKMQSSIEKILREEKQQLGQKLLSLLIGLTPKVVGTLSLSPGNLLQRLLLEESLPSKLLMAISQTMLTKNAAQIGMLPKQNQDIALWRPNSNQQRGNCLMTVKQSICFRKQTKKGEYILLKRS
jgi:hypothetical protein